MQYTERYLFNVDLSMTQQGPSSVTVQQLM